MMHVRRRGRVIDGAAEVDVMTKRWLALTVLCVTMALSSGCENHPVAGGKPTAAVCPTTSTLTYANFGMSFLAKYCQTCHASTVTGAARNGAPDDHTFDQLVDIRTLADHMDELAGAGPAAVNTVMPPTAPKPTEAERRQLSEWLACDAP